MTSSEFLPRRTQSSPAETSIDSLTAPASGDPEDSGAARRAGIASRRPAGRANLYRLNRQHLAAPHVIALARQRDELLDRLSLEVSAWPSPPILGAVFSSVARRDHATSSEIDILMVRADNVDDEEWNRYTDALSSLVTAWTGNDCQTLTFTASQVSRQGGREPDLTDVECEGIVSTAILRGLPRHSRAPAAEGPSRHGAAHSLVHAHSDSGTASESGIICRRLRHGPRVC